MIYHYTSIETLELLLKTQKIRFTRLDRVDDKSESEPFKGKPIADKVFVSCWTEDPTENVTLWSMYGDCFNGIRIGISNSPFVLKSVLPQLWNNLEIRNLKGNKTIFRPQDLLTPEYFLVPSFLDESVFFKRIIYVNSNDLESKYAQYTDIESLVGGQNKIQLDFMEIAQYKTKEWATQKEARFVLGILPVGKDLTKAIDFANPLFIQDLVSQLLDGILNEKRLSFAHFDVNLDPQALLNMEVVVGPRGDYQFVEALCRSYGLYRKPCQSRLKI